SLTAATIRTRTAALAGAAIPVFCGAKDSRRLTWPIRWSHEAAGAALKISEIFYSIQGEGSLVGVPSVFVRTSGCNLRCIWCDTPYTSWEPEGQELSLEEIGKIVTGFKAS